MKMIVSDSPMSVHENVGRRFGCNSSEFLRALCSSFKEEVTTEDAEERGESRPKRRCTPHSKEVLDFHMGLPLVLAVAHNRRIEGLIQDILIFDI